MPDLRPGAQRIADLFGSIQSAVGERMSTADLWAHLRDAAESAGRDLTGVNAIDVGQLRAMAAGLRDAVTSFDRAAPEASIPASAIAQNIYSRGLFAQSLAPAYHVRFVVNTSAGGESRQQRLTYILPGQLPATKGELMDALTGYGMALAEQGSSNIDAGSSFDGVDSIEISAV